jgi:hypothetical protein
MTLRRFVPLLALGVVTACAAEVPFETDSDLADDTTLQELEADISPESPAVDIDTVEAISTSQWSAENVMCTRHRYLHVANFSFVDKLSECVDGACPNGCWGAQRRPKGYACNYDGSAPGDVSVEYSGGFASYNEIKSLNPYDATAVANCRARTGDVPLRTYTVWNGAGWDSEGISASVHFAELYGTQEEAMTRFWEWHDGYRGRYSPMNNTSPNTSLGAVEVKHEVARMCAATRDHWLGIYYYNGGSAMPDWHRKAIIQAMNYCTTH